MLFTLANTKKKSKNQLIKCFLTLAQKLEKKT